MEIVNWLFSWTVGWFLLLFFFGGEGGSLFRLASIGKDKKSTGYAIRTAPGLLIF
jgi:hypothetical protein